MDTPLPPPAARSVPRPAQQPLPAPEPAGSAGPVGSRSGADVWATVDALRVWLDADRAHGGREGLLLRVLKLTEEVGEVAQAVIGATGQNPRKGVDHTWEDVQAELCDVVVTALVALRTLTPDAQAVFEGHLARVAERSLGGASERPE